MISSSAFVGPAGRHQHHGSPGNPRGFLLVLAAAALVVLVLSSRCHAADWIEVEATGYSPTDPGDAAYDATKGKWRWICADGKTDVRDMPYGVAIPRKQWPYGTKILIPASTGYVAEVADRVFVADDTGGMITIKTRETGTIHIDLRFKTPADALAFGKKTIRICINP